MKRKRIPLIFTALAMIVLILNSRNTLNLAYSGIDLCIRSVIPSLFPFFVLSIYLTGNLGSRGGMGAVIISGFLGGYPAGAQAAAECCASGGISRDTANRLLMFCSQAGPSFLFGIVSPQFPEARFAWMLGAVQLLSAMSVAFLFPVPKVQAQNHPQSPLSFPLAVKKATVAIASVCGWVILFRVLIGSLHFLNLGSILQILFSGLLELTNGCLLLETVENLELRFLLAAVMLNFGGVCVLMQTASAARGLDLTCYFLGKLLQTGFALLYSLALWGHFASLIPIFLIFLLGKLAFPRKNSSNPAPIVV